MPPLLAALITFGLIFWLFRRDFKSRPNVTSAIWLPFFWVFLSGSKFPSGWLALMGIYVGGTSVDEGSPVDALFFFVLIFGGLLVLKQRQVSLREFCRNNRWVAIYLIYCLIAITWSDFPMVAFKRWIKLFGSPVMVLVLLTEPDPLKSIARLLFRLAYIWIPMSILFSRYYPQWGIATDDWGSQPMNVGITTHKNMLGCDGFIVGLFIFWYYLQVRRWEPGPERKMELRVCLLFAVLIAWVMHMAHSSTSLGALLLGSILIILLGSDRLDMRRLNVYVVTILVVGISAEMTLGVHEYFIGLLGRDSTLTGRTEVWKVLWNWDLNPIFGVGYESFWQESRMAKVWAITTNVGINQAHNGYLETYINLGLLGVALTITMLLATYGKGRQALQQGIDFGRFRLAYLVAFMLYNWTEAAFRTHCVPFFMFFLVAIDYPRPAQVEVENTEPMVDT